MDVVDRLRVSGVELRRYRVIQDLIDKSTTQKEAALALDLSVRQVGRLLSQVKKRGIDGVIHGLVGRPSNRRLGSEIEQQVLDLWNSKYRPANLNFSHFTEKLNEVEKIEICKEKVRTLLRSHGVADQAVKKGRKHRKQRPRRERFGELVQLDTSPHDWLSNGTEYHCVVAIDDSTSRLLFVRIYEHDGTMANMEAIRSVILKFGIPMCVYTDAASWFKVTRHWEGTINRRGNTEYCTQIQRALDELGVELLIAGSPQAKGRVERSNGTLQDRLIAELRLRKIHSLEAANSYIEHEFIDDHNRRFAKEPRTHESAFLPFLRKDTLDRMLCLKFHSQVQNDNTVKKSKYYHLQLLPTPMRLSWAKAPVEVSLRLDGSAEVRHRKTGEAIPHEVLRLEIPREFKRPKALHSEQDIFIWSKEDISI